MSYSRTRTIKETSRLGSITLSPDGSLHVAWDMLDELGGSTATPGAHVAAVDVPKDLTVLELYEWADAKIVNEQGARDVAEAAAIDAAKNGG